MTISGFDHAAIPIDSVDAMLHFYASLGFEVRHNPPFFSVHFGDSKINFHGPEVWHSSTFTLKGSTAVPGCGDFCFVWSGTQTKLDTLLKGLDIAAIEGPIERSGALVAEINVTSLCMGLCPTECPNHIHLSAPELT